MRIQVWRFGRAACALLVIAGAAAAQDGQPGPPQSIVELSAELTALAGRVSPSVVQVHATGYVLEQKGDATADLRARGVSTGSGVILHPDGYIVTNAHVVDGARRIQVELALPGVDAPGRSILRSRGRLLGAQVVAVDRETDLAVLKVPEKGLPALPFGDSDALQPGQLVLAFGSPLGLANSVTLGVVSAVARQLQPESPMIYVQTDAPINPGNSGGPLVDAHGRLVGINTLIFSQSGGSEGVGFAAPSNIVRNVFEQIRQTGRVRRGDVGVSAQTITPALAAGLALGQDWGVVLADVAPGGPADRAGLRPGDVVLSLDGKVLENGRQLQVNLYRRNIGEQVRFEILRGGRRLSAPVPVAERADDPDRFATMVDPDRHLVPRLGVLALTIEEPVASMLPLLRLPDGVIVAAVGSDAPVMPDGGLVPGDVIHALNGRPVASLDDLKARLAAMEVGAAAVLQVERRARLLYVAFRVE